MGMAQCADSLLEERTLHACGVLAGISPYSLGCQLQFSLHTPGPQFLCDLAGTLSNQAANWYTLWLGPVIRLWHSHGHAPLGSRQLFQPFLCAQRWYQRVLRRRVDCPSYPTHSQGRTSLCQLHQ